MKDKKKFKRKQNLQLEHHKATLTWNRSVIEDVQERRSEKFKYNEHIKNIAYRMALLGLTNHQMAEVLDINSSTFEEWMWKKPDFRDKIKQGRVVADGKVAQALYQSALGYSHPDVHILPNRVKTFDSEGNVIEEHTEPLIVPTVKQYPPSVTAAIKWLAVRQPELWNEKRKLEIDQRVIIGNINMEDFTDAELIALEQIGLAKADFQTDDE